MIKVKGLSKKPVFSWITTLTGSDTILFETGLLFSFKIYKQQCSLSKKKKAHDTKQKKSAFADLSLLVNPLNSPFYTDLKIILTNDFLIKKQQEGPATL